MPEERFAHEEDLALLRKAFARLPEQTRELLVLSRLEGMRYDEIARRFAQAQTEALARSSAAPRVVPWPRSPPLSAGSWG